MPSVAWKVKEGTFERLHPYSFLIPSLRMRVRRVEGLMSRITAAPLGPSMRQPVSSSIRVMWSTSMLAWRPIVIHERVFENAWLIQDRCPIPWWDCPVVSAAQLADCRYLLSEIMTEYL